MLHPSDPPIVFPRLQDLPVVDRTAPQLSCFAEIVGRHTSHGHHFLLVIQLENFAGGPEVGTVIGHVDWDIADEPDPPLIAIFLERKPLLVKNVLEKFLQFNVVVKIFLQLFESLRLPLPYLIGPFVPVPPWDVFLEGEEEDHIVEPVGMANAERFIIAVMSRQPEAFMRQREKCPLIINDLAEIHPITGEFRGRLDLVLFKISIPDEKLRADQQRIAGEGRDAMVRGILAGRIGECQREDLPVALSGLVQEICESICPGSQVPYSKRGGKGCDVEKNSTASLSHCFLTFRFVAASSVWICNVSPKLLKASSQLRA
jgi:hypothetical protein